MDKDNDNNYIYTFHDKENIVKKISKIKNINILKQIYNTIKENNNKFTPSRNINGIFIKFDALNNITYVKIDELINNIPKSKKKNNNNTCKYIPYLENDYLFESNTKLRYSNREKIFINKIDYKKQLTKTINESKDMLSLISDT